MLLIIMPFTLEDKKDLLALCTSQIEALKEHSKETRSNPSLFQQGIPAFGIKLDPFDRTWLNVEPLETNSVHKIKLHIPLQNWRENALMLANVIKQHLTSAMAGIKTINPLIKEDELDGLFSSERIVKSTPITIYFVESATPCEIAGAIYTINRLLTEVDKVQPINTCDAAASDQSMGFCSITIHVSQQRKYLDGRQEDGIRARQDLLRNSPEISDIKQILALLARIDAYIQDRESKGEYTSCWGSMFGAYTKDTKIAAAEKLKKAIITNSSIDEYFLGPLNQGNLGNIFAECKQIMPILAQKQSYNRIETT